MSLAQQMSGAPLGAAGAGADPMTASVDELLKTLERRNLAWKLMMGSTISTLAAAIGSDPTNVPVILDGDTQPVRARSLIQPWTGAGRVFVIFVPPHGYYIVGYASNNDHNVLIGESGIQSFSFTGTSATANITFAKPFRQTPRVTTNIHSGAGVTAQWSSRFISGSPTGGQIFIYAAPGAVATTWSGQGVFWVAVEPNTS